MSDNPYDRPLVVTLIGVFYAALAAFFFFVAAIFLIGGEVLIENLIDSNPDVAELRGLSALIGGTAVGVGLLFCIVSYGFFKGWSVVWYLGILFAVVLALFCIPPIAIGMLVFAGILVIDAAVILLLFKPDVKLFFLKHE